MTVISGAPKGAENTNFSPLNVGLALEAQIVSLGSVTSPNKSGSISRSIESGPHVSEEQLGFLRVTKVDFIFEAIDRHTIRHDGQ